MPVSTFCCIVVAMLVLLASNEDLTELKAQQIVAKNTLTKIRIMKQLNKEQKHGNSIN